MFAPTSTYAVHKHLRSFLGHCLLATAVLLVVLAPAIASAAAPQDTYTWQRNIGTPGCPPTAPAPDTAGSTSLCIPTSVTRDNVGNLYVVDINRYNVKIYGPDGSLKTVFGSQGTGTGQFSNPYAIALDSNGNIFVLDLVYGGSRVEKFDGNGNYLSQFSPAPAPGASAAYSASIAIAISRDNTIYLSSSGYSGDFSTRYSAIQKYSRDGMFLSEFGSYGIGDGQFISPNNIALDTAGNLYMIDHDAYRVEKFDVNGNYLSKFGSRDSACDGTATDTFCLPDSLALDSAGNIYVGDGDGYVKKFDSRGAFLSKFGGNGSADNQFGGWEPSLIVDNDGNVYVLTSTYNVGGHISVWNAPIIPSPPQSVAATPLSSTSLKLSWLAPAHIGSSPLTFYKVQYRPADSTTWTTAATLSPATLSYTLENLSPGTNYDIQVVAGNVLGASTDVPSQAGGSSSGIVTAATLTKTQELVNTGLSVLVYSAVAGSITAISLVVWKRRKAVVYTTSR